MRKIAPWLLLVLTAFVVRLSWTAGTPAPSLTAADSDADVVAGAR